MTRLCSISWHVRCGFPLALALCSFLTSLTAADLGVFETHQDIGTVAKPGAVQFNPETKSYRVSGGGENMWFARDDFHFVWKKMEGDVSLTADIEWLSSGGNAHRKACLVFRQSLDPDSPYIDVAVHGDGLTSLQFRDTPGGPTREVQGAIRGPQRARLLKRGDEFLMFLGKAGQQSACSGATYKLPLKAPFYVGLGVCAHDNNAIETAQFSNVALESINASPGARPLVESTLEIVPIGSKDRRVLFHTPAHIEAPNWSPDGKFLLYNSHGRIFRLRATGGDPQPLHTGFAIRCNNDHGISSDGKQLVISDQTRDGKSRIYILPIEGGDLREITPLAPSYWHGWSPDGKTLAYCAERNNNYDIYTIPVAGGDEKRLTDSAGLDDGPDYSPDGKHIYFNSERSGSMQIWRMKTDGSGQEAITNDSFNNWFPHLSPDGKWLVVLSYDSDVKGHPENKDVQLRLVNLQTREVQPLAKLFGGQGTINVPSWSPDSRQVAFVSYHYAAK